MKHLFLVLLIAMVVAIETPSNTAGQQPLITYTWIDQTHAEVCVFAEGELFHNGVWVYRGANPMIPDCYIFPPPGLIESNMDPKPGSVASLRAPNQIHITIGVAILGDRPPRYRNYFPLIAR